MGNAAVLKPAEEASLTALAFARIAMDCGLPAGALNVVPGLGEEAGAALCSHPGVNHISFTGSLETGRKIQQAAAQNVIPVTLELAENPRRSSSPMPISSARCRSWSMPGSRMPDRPVPPRRASSSRHRCTRIWSG
jgi:hypothetical protein